MSTKIISKTTNVEVTENQAGTIVSAIKVALGTQFPKFNVDVTSLQVIYHAGNTTELQTTFVGADHEPHNLEAYLAHIVRQ